MPNAPWFFARDFRRDKVVYRKRRYLRNERRAFGIVLDWACAATTGEPAPGWMLQRSFSSAAALAFVDKTKYPRPSRLEGAVFLRERRFCVPHFWVADVIRAASDQASLARRNGTYGCSARVYVRCVCLSPALSRSTSRTGRRHRTTSPS